MADHDQFGEDEAALILRRAAEIQPDRSLVRQAAMELARPSRRSRASRSRAGGSSTSARSLPLLAPTVFDNIRDERHAQLQALADGLEDRLG